MVARTPLEDLLRRLAPEVLGAVVRGYGNFDLAEDAVQEALLAASLQWSAEGVPDSPRGWMIRVASRRLTDLLRSEQARRRREDIVARLTLPEQPDADRPDSDVDDSLVLADAVRGHLLEMAGERAAAYSSYLAAARQTTSLPQQRYLHAKAARLAEEE